LGHLLAERDVHAADADDGQAFRLITEGAAPPLARFTINAVVAVSH
jgi:hypothetical protein